LEKAFSWLPDPEGKFERAYTRWGRRHQFIYYLAANLIEAFGPDEWHEKWAAIALGELRRRLEELARPKRKRIRTKPPRSARAKVRKEKTQRSEKKASRKRPRTDD